MRWPRHLPTPSGASARHLEEPRRTMTRRRALLVVGGLAVRCVAHLERDARGRAARPSAPRGVATRCHRTCRGYGAHQCHAVLRVAGRRGARARPAGGALRRRYRGSGRPDSDRPVRRGAGALRVGHSERDQGACVLRDRGPRRRIRGSQPRGVRAHIREGRFRNS